MTRDGLNPETVIPADEAGNLDPVDYWCRMKGGRGGGVSLGDSCSDCAQ